jgi:hypothetical protein
MKNHEKKKKNNEFNTVHLLISAWFLLKKFKFLSGSDHSGPLE